MHKASRRLKNRRWKQTIAMMVCLAVFSSTYALLLPVAATQQEHICGMEAHIHAETCYTESVITELTCTLEEQQAHTHEGGCYEMRDHQHSNACFNEVHMLDCGILSTDKENVLVCAKPERIEHTHSEECYDVEGTLICTLPEFVSHEHGGACYSSHTENNLSCGLEEHSHTEACVGEPLEEEPTESEAAEVKPAEEQPSEESTEPVLGEGAAMDQPAETEEADSPAPPVMMMAAAPQSASGQVRSDLPDAVITGGVNVSALRFYNLCEGNGGVAPLAGCVFEVVGPNGYKITLTSGNTPEVMLPQNMPNGTYTITEISVPDGHMRDTEYQRMFVVNNGKFDQNDNIGTFINHDLQVLSSHKTAEVEDYNNRIYRILLDAENHMRMYEMDPVDVLFVVDQSNSMLFPSGLTSTGKSIILHKDGRWGNANNQNNSASMNNLGLSKDQVYYIISDPQGTSTVFAIYWDDQLNEWMFQDASYYAKAKHDNKVGYQDPNERAIFPSNRSFSAQKDAEANTGTKSNGGSLSQSFNGSSLYTYMGTGSDAYAETFVLYVASGSYNRLHYLEEAMTNMIYELANANDQNRVTLIGFTKELKMDVGPYYLTPDNTEYLVSLVNSINTGGGTRQDVGLKTAFNEHLNDRSENFNKGPQYTYTILITDGAPVRSSGDPELGNANSQATTDANGVIYGQIKGWANQVKTKSSLMTVGLGMKDVAGGHAVLNEIASAGHYCALDDAAQLVKEMQELLFDNFHAKEEIVLSGTIVDEISDSFYPIAWVEQGQGAATGRTVLLSDGTRDWILLHAGDWVTADGKYTISGAADAAGQLSRKEDGTFYITWQDAVLNDGWDATFYVKAKEDFIGGNAIDTNKTAHITVSDGAEITGRKTLDTPTVNVRLLGMNELSSEVTVYLGDIINENGDRPLDSLISFWDQLVFTKLVAGTGNVLNKTSVIGSNGLAADHFALEYPLGSHLPDGVWQSMIRGHGVTMEYTYDDASSHGPVGYFTFSVEKQGETAEYGTHIATEDCQPGGSPLTEDCDSPVETYILRVTYTAYKLGEQGRAAANANNGSGSPGTQVGTGATLPTGLGVVESRNVHEVHVISGVIDVTKVIEPGMEPESDKTFTFTLHRKEDGSNTDYDVIKTVTIPAGSGGPVTVRFEGLRRGSYTVTEGEDDEYMLRRIKVLETTNCESTPIGGETAQTVTFVMGNNTAKMDVIGKVNETDPYPTYIDPINGVYGAVEFVNTEITYVGEIPVQKVWDDGAERHNGDDVYLILFLNGEPVLNEEGYHRVILLNAQNNWTGSFAVPLKNKTDTVSNYNYTVREASDTSGIYKSGWYKAVRENDGMKGYYEVPLDEGDKVLYGLAEYSVHYLGKDGDGVWVVENQRTYELPETGGSGTQGYTLGGTLLIAVAGVSQCILWRKRREREG